MKTQETEKNITAFSSLHPELISFIFSFLPVPNILRVQEVCGLWLNLAPPISYLNDTQFKYNDLDWYFSKLTDLTDLRLYKHGNSYPFEELSLMTNLTYLCIERENDCLFDEVISNLPNLKHLSSFYNDKITDNSLFY